jgi:hypothetical protein
VFVEPYAHLCHLGRKVSLGRQLHDNRSHLALRPQWPDGATRPWNGEGVAPGWGEQSPAPLPFGLGPARLARSDPIRGVRQQNVSRADDRARPRCLTARPPLSRRLSRPFRRGFRQVSLGPRISAPVFHCFIVERLPGRIPAHTCERCCRALRHAMVRQARAPRWPGACTRA